MATNTRKAILIRTGFVYAGMVVFAAAIFWHLFNIKFVERNKWLALADSLTTKVVSIDAVRGNIFDCNGNLLATSVPIYDIHIDGKAEAFKDDETFYKELDSLSIALSGLFKDKPASTYKRILTNIKQSGNRYFLFKRKISYTQMKQLQKLPLFNLGRYKGGLRIDEKTRREKPFDLLAYRTIGFNQDKVAKVGLEGTFDKYLQGKSGKRVMQRIAGGTFIPVDAQKSIEAKNGNDIITTIDINLQDVAEHALMNSLVENDAEYGTAILMEVETGAIKAIANLKKSGEGVYTEEYNYAIGENLEPGSTFKLASMMALLEDEKVKPTDIINAEGGVKTFCNATMYDSHLGAQNISMQEAFEHSSNVAIAKQMVLSYGKNPTKVYEHYTRLNLTKPLGIEIDGEKQPNVKSPSHKSWSCTSLPWMSIGYEVLISPLQVLSVYNAIANNGVMVKPYIVSEIKHSGKTIKSFEPTIINDRVCKEKTAKQLRNMMEGVVLRGTAKRLKSDFYSYAGKTGTALIANNKHGYTSNGGKAYRASFCGYFPANDPKFSCYVMISKPSKSKIYGAEVALPVFKEIADKVYATALNLHKDFRYADHFITKDLPIIRKAQINDLTTVLNQTGVSNHLHEDSIKAEESIWASALPQDKSVAIEPLLHVKNKTPDVLGMKAKDAIYLLESKGFEVQIIGVGKVIQQSVQPGKNFYKGTQITIKLG